MSDLDLERLHAQIWGAFGQGAGMPFSLECVDEAIDLGYYRSIETNKEILLNDPRKLEETRNCAKRAGNMAAFLAREEPDNTEIQRAHFKQAYEDVRERVTRVRERMISNGTHSGLIPWGGGCG